MGKYYIDYNTGAGNVWVEGTIDDAKSEADNGAAYTQRKIEIKDEAGETVCFRQWWGVEFDPDVTEETEDEVITFGQFGYFGAWQET